MFAECHDLKAIEIYNRTTGRNESVFDTEKYLKEINASLNFDRYFACELLVYKYQSVDSSFRHFCKILSKCTAAPASYAIDHSFDCTTTTIVIDCIEYQWHAILVKCVLFKALS